MKLDFEAVTNGGWGGSSGSTITQTHTTSVVDGIVFIGIFYNPNGQTLRTITGVTYDGVAMTKINNQVDPNPYYMELWYIVSPNKTVNANVVVTFSGSLTNQFVGTVVASYGGVRQSTSPHTSGHNTKNVSGSRATSWSITQDTSGGGYNCWVVGIFGTEAVTASAGSGTTKRGANSSGAVSLMDSGSAVSPSGNKQLNATTGSNTFWQAIVCYIEPEIYNKKISNPAKRLTSF